MKADFVTSRTCPSTVKLHCKIIIKETTIFARIRTFLLQLAEQFGNDISMGFKVCKCNLALFEPRQSNE